MKRKVNIIKPLLLIGILSSSFSLVSCKKKEKDEPAINKNIFTLNESDKELAYGDTFKLNAYFPSGTIDQITWTSTNDNIISVAENGMVTAINLGEAYVVAETSEYSLSCHFNVTFGKFIPDLIINNISGDEIIIAKNDYFALNAKVSYKNKMYDTSYVVSDYNDEIIEYKDGFIVGKSVGSSHLTIIGDWNGVNSEYIKKTISVNVVDNVSFYSNVTINNETNITNSFSLSSVSSWCGKTYSTSALIEPIIYINDQYHLANFVIENNGVLTNVGNTIFAKKPGSNIINLTYFDENSGIQYNSTIKVIVSCPIEKYTGDLVKFSSEERFPVEKYFGNNAVILSAKQNGTNLTVHDNFIDNLDQLGADSKPLEIITDKGGYYFDDPFIYTRLINKDNFLSTFTLDGSSIISGYYILSEDIDTEINFNVQKACSKTSYFNGVFDGQCHSIKALVGQNGIFGGLGKGAIIKDCKFNIKFDCQNENASYCGLANNTSIFNNNDWDVNLVNIYLTTLNFEKNCHALFEYRPNNLHMNDCYIEINGVDSLPTFNNVNQDYAALFRYDVTPLTGPSNQFYGDMRNNFVICNKFMPLANADFSGMKGRYVSYAKNDDKYLKLDDDTSMIHSVDKPDQSRYRIVYPGKNATQEQRNLYGFVNVPELVTTGVIPSLDYPIAAFYSSSYSDGGIARYNTIEDANISNVGTWEII